MSSRLRLGDRSAEQWGPCYVIAEAGSNHDGRISQALELIDVAAEAGADAVKFQLFRAETLYPRNCGVVDTAAGEADFFKLMERMEMPSAWTGELAVHARARGVHLLFSVFDEDMTDVAMALDPVALKIASPELTHLPLLRYAAGRGVPLLLSTGMSRLGEIEEALDTVREAGNPAAAVLHCVTSYPCPPDDANVSVVGTLARSFDVPAGLSDHTLDPIAAPIVSVSVGGCILEKHFTLSRGLDGPDHPFSIEPAELAAMVSAIRDLEGLPRPERHGAVADRLGPELVQRLLGDPVKRVLPSEAELAACDRRSLHATRDIEPGEVLDSGCVAILRGERNLRPGLHPRYWPMIEGATSTRFVPAGEGLTWRDVLTTARATEARISAG